MIIETIHLGGGSPSLIEVGAALRTVRTASFVRTAERKIPLLRTKLSSFVLRAIVEFAQVFFLRSYSRMVTDDVKVGVRIFLKKFWSHATGADLKNHDMVAIKIKCIDSSTNNHVRSIHGSMFQVRGSIEIAKCRLLSEGHRHLPLRDDADRQGSKTSCR